MSKEIKCVDCDKVFNFSDGEEKYYAERDLVPPKRCQKCRIAKRKERDSQKANPKNW